MRQYTVADAEDVYKNWAGDERIALMSGREIHPSVMFTTEYLSGLCGLYVNKEFYKWIIELKSTGEAIGSIAITVNNRDEIGDLGYCVGERFQSHGYMTEAVGKILEFAFNTVGFNKITASYTPDNVASGRVMMKNHFIYEGRLRQAHKRGDGQFEDLLVYGKLKNE